MDRQSTPTQTELQSMLFDEKAEPKALPLSLLEEITKGFSEEQEIGRGGFAVVYKGVLNNGVAIAVKRLSHTYMYEKQFHREIECLIKVKHKNVVRFIGYCVDSQGLADSYDGKFVMAEVQQRLLCFEYLPHGTLDKYITDASCGLDWRMRYRIISGICDGLHYLHQNRIVHLDLKPPNILLDGNMLPKIADFGLSRCFEENQSRAITSKISGTMGYLAPEFGSREITYQLDLYSLGVIIIEILTGKKGYEDVENVLESWSKRLEKSHRDVQREQVRVCTEIGIECIESNPAKRPVSMQQIIARLHETGTTEGFIETVMTRSSTVQDKTDYDDLDQGAPKALGGTSSETCSIFGLVDDVPSVVVSTTSSRFVTNNQVLEHSRSCEASVSPRKESQLNSLDLPNDRSTYCRSRKSTNIVFPTRIPSSPPSSRGQHCPTSPVNSRAFGQLPVSPTGWQDDSRSSSSSYPLPLPPGTPCTSSRSLHSQWKKGRLLGSGTFGQVFLTINSEDGQMCAIKEVKVIADDSKSKEYLRQLNQEMLLLNELSHPNIVQCHGSELSSETLSVYFEFVSGGSIHKLLKEYGPFGEAVLRNYTAQILSALAYLHGRKIVHRDIKGANILVDPNGTLKLAGFGVAKHLSEYTSTKSVQGTVYWMAPEVIMNTNGYSLSVDIWSLGCTVLEMATTRSPWSQYEGVAVIFKIANSKDIPDIPDHLSSEAKSFLKLCLQRDPAARPTAAQLIEHPWVKDQASVRSSRSGIRDMFPTSTDSNKTTVKKGVELSSYRSLSPLRDTNLGMRNLSVAASSIPAISTRRISTNNASNVHMNMSLPVSSFSSPSRQYKQLNRSSLPSPPHPAYSAGAANYSPTNNALYPMRPSNYRTD